MFRIVIDQDDIDEGVRKDCYRCPVQSAIWRALELDLGAPGPVKLAVQPEIISLWSGDQMLCIETPPALADFISAFDALGPGAVSPITFEMDLSPFWLLLYGEAVPV